MHIKQIMNIIFFIHFVHFLEKINSSIKLWATVKRFNFSFKTENVEGVKGSDEYKIGEEIRRQQKIHSLFQSMFGHCNTT